MKISDLVDDALKAVDWMKAATDSTTNSESLAALLIKTAIDGFKLAEGGGSLMTLIADIEKDITAYESARSTNVAAGTVDPPVPAIAEAPVA